MPEIRRDGSRLLERAVEAHLEEQMKRIGGRAYKFEPSVKGNPDRIVVFPRGRIYFVELKRPGGSLSPMQKLWHQRLREMGHEVHVLDSRETVSRFIAWAIYTGVGCANAETQIGRDRAAISTGYRVGAKK